MDFRIADTFTDSLARLTGEEQKAVKTTAFDLQLNPANPGMQFHRLDRAKNKNFWSVRVSRDIRLIVHRTAGSLLLCYVDHHDDAYAWAEKRKLETHPTTGAAQLDGQKFGARFLLTEWSEVVDAWQLGTREAYRDVSRLGRKTRLPERQREVLWRVFEQVREELDARGLVTWPELYHRLAAHLGYAGAAPFDFIVIDEAQDVSVAQLRLLAALGGNRPDGLFLAGDLGQRIFQAPFSWKALGVDVRGRSSTLRINYRTSHQIRSQADRLLAPEVSDVDGNTESRRAVSVFNGPDPAIQVLETPEEESEAVGQWLADRASEGVEPHEIGVFVRSTTELPRAREAVEAAGLPYRVLDEHLDTVGGHASIGTMHLAKGLEFRAVVVMACDDEVIPSQERIETVGDEADLEEVYNTERHLLCVACTRARDHLLVTSADPPSEFLDDLRG
jgi:mRNA-degrading endonuclease RelE of RelBE toxin-antitoxin system